MKLLATAVLSLALALAPTAANAVVIVDYLGYGYETGGFLPSDPGDVLVFVATATQVDPITGVNLASEEVTFYAYGLVSTGQVVDGGGNTIVSYVGGMLEVYRDPSQNAVFGVFPPNATTPSTFSDGILLFEGTFTSFTIAIQPDGSGVYEGNLDGIAGLLLSAVCSDCGYTWGGAWTNDAGAQIPDGFDLQIDGKLDVNLAVPTESSAWGGIKALYRD